MGWFEYFSKATVTQIVTRYNQRRHRTISECTTLKQIGHSRCNLSAKNRKLRLQFTQAHQNCTIEFDVNNTMYPLGHFIPTVLAYTSPAYLEEKCKSGAEGRFFSLILSKSRCQQSVFESVFKHYGSLFICTHTASK